MVIVVSSLEVVMGLFSMFCVFVFFVVVCVFGELVIISIGRLVVVGFEKSCFIRVKLDGLVSELLISIRLG